MSDNNSESKENEPIPVVRQKRNRRPMKSNDPNARELISHVTVSPVSKKKQSVSQETNSTDDTGSLNLKPSKKAKTKQTPSSDKTLHSVDDVPVKKIHIKNKSSRKDLGKFPHDEQSAKPYPDSLITATIRDLLDDVVDHKDLQNIEGCVVKGIMESQPVPKTYIEGPKYFEAVHRNTNTTDEMLNIKTENNTQSPINTALACQKIFHVISTMCYGLLAGMALWQCVMVYLLQTSDVPDFLHYSWMTKPFQSLFYMLIAICSIGVLDRYDIGDLSLRIVYRMLTCQSAALVVLIYFGALTLTLSTAELDDKFSKYNSSSTTCFQRIESNDLNLWNALNLSRCILVILAWLIIAFRPQTDFLHKKLSSLVAESTTQLQLA